MGLRALDLQPATALFQHVPRNIRAVNLNPRLPRGYQQPARPAGHVKYGPSEAVDPELEELKREKSEAFDQFRIHRRLNTRRGTINIEPGGAAGGRPKMAETEQG